MSEFFRIQPYQNSTFISGNSEKICRRSEKITANNQRKQAID